MPASVPLLMSCSRPDVVPCANAAMASSTAIASTPTRRRIRSEGRCTRAGSSGSSPSTSSAWAVVGAVRRRRRQSPRARPPAAVASLSESSSWRIALLGRVSRCARPRRRRCPGATKRQRCPPRPRGAHPAVSSSLLDLVSPVTARTMVACPADTGGRQGAMRGRTVCLKRCSRGEGYAQSPPRHVVGGLGQDGPDERAEPSRARTPCRSTRSGSSTSPSGSRPGVS